MIEHTCTVQPHFTSIFPDNWLSYRRYHLPGGISFDRLWSPIITYPRWLPCDITNQTLVVFIFIVSSWMVHIPCVTSYELHKLDFDSVLSRYANKFRQESLLVRPQGSPNARPPGEPAVFPPQNSSLLMTEHKISIRLPALIVNMSPIERLD
jgi:hypothetical protein